MKYATILFGLFIYILNLPLSAKEIQLSGIQKKNRVSIHLNGNTLYLKGDYIVPKGKELILIGSGQLKSKVLGEKEIIVDPHTDNVTQDIRRDYMRKEYAKLRIKGKIIYKSASNGDLAKLHFNHRFIHYDQKSVVILKKVEWKDHFQFNGDILLAEYVTFQNGLSLGSSSSNLKFRRCNFERYLQNNLEPILLSQKVKIDSCTIADRCRVGLNFLWVMEKCNIYGRPFLIKNYRWKKVPKLKKNYFDDREYELFLKEALKIDLKGLRLVSYHQPLKY